jgi:ankyrin repeat protein
MTKAMRSRAAWGIAAVLAVVWLGWELRSVYVRELRDDARLGMWRGLSFLTHDEARALVDQGVSINDRGNDDQTLLMVASQEGNDDTVQILIALGADVHAQDEHGNTALLLAKQAGKSKVVNLLQKAGAQR